MNQFMEAMAPYRDKFGFPSGAKDAFPASKTPDGNCLMFLGEEMLILMDQGLWRYEDQKRFTSLLALCAIATGDYRRTPVGCLYSNDQEQWDDYIGVAVASRLTGTFHAMAILHYGQTHFFRWGPFRLPFAFPLGNTEETTEVNAWLERNLAFIAHLYWCAAEKPPIVMRLAWAWCVAFAGWSQPLAQDPWRLTYLMIRGAFCGVGPRWWQIEYWATKLWVHRLFKHWPAGIPAVRARYFNDPNHPLSTWMREAK